MSGKNKNKKMKIILIYDGYFDVLHLTEKEREFMFDYDLPETEQERVEQILYARNIPVSNFSPLWITSNGDVPIFDETNNSCPVYTIR